MFNFKSYKTHNLDSDDLHRVMLCEIPGEEGSDYINGSYIPVRYILQ